MNTIKCAVCKKPAFPGTIAGNSPNKWICSSCTRHREEQLNTAGSPAVEYCQSCKKRNNGKCRFSLAERRRITACSDWEGKNTEHDKKRWAKFEE